MEGVEEAAMSSITIVSNNKTAIIGATEKAVRKAARMIGGTVAGHAVELAPVDTGLLRNSITFALGGQPPQITTYSSEGESASGKKIEKTEGHYDGEAPPDNSGEVTVYVGTNVEYAPYQELGTVKMDARPFLRPAMENSSDEIEQIIRKCFKDLN